jgi:hypothetical protein
MSVAHMNTKEETEVLGCTAEAALYPKADPSLRSG